MRPYLTALALALGLSPSGAALAQVASPHAIDIPRWFSESFLELREEVRDASKEGRRLMLYFGQDGCPYCKALMKVNFGDPGIAAFTRKNFVAVALNIWGDREVTWLDGRRMSEKQLASFLKVQYTPTLLFFDEKGGIALRLNGYQPPEKFRKSLEFARLPVQGRPAYIDFMEGRKVAPPAEEDIGKSLAKGKPVLVLVTRAGCKECDELEREGFARPEVASLLKRFTVARRDPAGAWAGEQGLTYIPSLVLLEPSGKEAFRAEGYMRPFHLASVLEYVASGAYRKEPSFQRYVQARAERLRHEGKPVDLWK